MAMDSELRQNGLERTESSLVSRNSGMQWPGWLAAVVVVAAFSISQGLSGIVAGLATAVVWAAIGTPSAVATGTVLLIAQTPEGADPLGAAVVACGLVALVLAPAVTARYSAGYAGAVVLTTAVFGALARLAAGSLELWLTTLVLAGTALLAAYGLHRYLRLRLGLLEGTANTDESPTENTA